MQEDSPQGMNIKYYTGVVIRRRYLALSVAVAVLSVCTLGSFFWPKKYQASSIVLVEKGSILDALVKDVGASRSPEDVLGSLKNNLISRTLLERVVKKVYPEVSGGNAPQLEGMISGIRRNIDIKVQGSREIGGNDTFTVMYKGNDPRIVRDMVNTLISELMQESEALKMTDVSGAYEFIEGQLMEYKNKLEESDKAIREYRERNPSIIPQNETAIAGRIETLQTGRMEAEIRLKELMRKRETLQRQLSGEKELTVAFVTSEGSPQGRLNYLNNQLVILMSKYTEKYPEVIKVKSEIEELKKEIAEARASNTHGGGSETSAINPIYQQLREEVAKADTEIESLKARAAELSRQQQDGQNFLGKMPKEQEEWTKLQRDRNVYQKIYDELLRKLESAKVSKDLESTSKSGAFKVLDPAVLPVLPIQPNRVAIILAGIVLGIASGIGLVIGLERLNPSFRDENEIESLLKLPVLGTIPSIVTEEDRSAGKKRDRRAVIAAAAYLFVIGLLLANEVLYRYFGIKTFNF
jgi:succinoglycan biosynthesis transport protein ExoP